MGNPELIYFDGFCLDVEKQELSKEGECVVLPKKALQVLQILSLRSGTIVTKECIYNEIWADSFVEDANLTQYIYLLRKALGRNKAGISYIETAPRAGYIFTAEVKRASRADAFQGKYFKANPLPSTAAAAVNGKLEQNGNARPHDTFSPALGLGENASVDGNSKIDANSSYFWKSRIFKRSKPATRLLLASTSVFLIFLVWLLISTFFNAPPSAVPITSIAVLPFRQIDQESRESRVGLGMADAIISRITKLRKIPVRSTSAIFLYGDQQAVNVTEVGRELGVSKILEGTIQRDGERVRVSVQLTNVADGRSLWTETFDEKFTGIFALQDSISNKVARSLFVNLTNDDYRKLEERPTDNMEAYESFQLGFYFWNTRTGENLRKASKYFEKAIELDPRFAKSHALLADTYNMLGYYGFADPVEMTTKANAAADNAIALDNSIAEAYLAKAFIRFLSADYEASESFLQKAISLDPFNPTVRIRHGWTLLGLGRTNDAVAEMRTAQENDPISPVSNGALCNMLAYQEKYDQALEVCQKAVELSPTTAENRLSLATALFFQGSTEEAITQVKIDLQSGRKPFSSLGSLGYFYAKLGRRSEAESIVTQLKSEVKNDPGLYNNLLLINLALGRRKEALIYFQESLNFKVLPKLLVLNDPIWKDVRGDPDFLKLLEA